MSLSRKARVRTLVVAAAAAVMIVWLMVIGGPASGSASSAAAGEVPRLVPTKCPDELTPAAKGAKCDHLIVPENHSRPNGRQIRLTVVRIPALSKEPSSRPPVVYLNGGPGADAIGFTPELLEIGLNQDRELIVITQRGTFGASPMLACPEMDRFRARSLGYRSDGARNRKAVRRAAAKCRARLKERGVNRASFDTTQSARDVVALRRLLGVEKWDVYSHSYGTDLALTYMRRFPKGIRSVVLDGTVPPSVASLGWTWSSFRESADNIFAACRAQRSCRDRFPNVQRTYTRLVNKLEKNPITTRVKVPGQKQATKVLVDGTVLVNWMTRQSHFAETIPLEISQLANGNPKPIARDWAGARVIPKRFWGGFGWGLPYSIWCSEWVPFESRREEMRKARRAFPGFPRQVLSQAPQLTFLRDICKAWRVPKASKSIREVTRSKIPTLALSGTFDAQTGARWGRYAARTLRNSTVVDLPGVAHGVASNPCGSKIVASFYRRPMNPDVRCARDVRPKRFLTRPPGKASGSAFSAPYGQAEERNRGGGKTVALHVQRVGPPRHVRASDGRVHVVYNLFLTNSFVGDVTLKRLKIKSGGKVLQDLGPKEFAAHTHPILRESVNLGVLAPSTSAMVLVDIPLRRGARLPSSLNHRISYSLPKDFPANAVIDSTVAVGPRLRVPARRAVTIAPPLRGSGWWAGGGCCHPDQRHRGALLTGNGRFFTSEMFDIDWLQVQNGGIFSGDGKSLTDYHGYGKKIYAVAPGKVIRVTNNRPEAPLDGPNEDLDGADTFAGNKVIIRMGKNLYQFYGHFQPGSVRVRRGQHVKAGKVLGLLGNSGNSSAPHLHFGIHDGPVPATSNSLPFRIDRYRYQGSADFDEENGTVPLKGKPRNERSSYPLNLSAQRYR